MSFTVARSRRQEYGARQRGPESNMRRRRRIGAQRPKASIIFNGGVRRPGEADRGREMKRGGRQQLQGGEYRAAYHEAKLLVAERTEQPRASREIKGQFAVDGLLRSIPTPPSKAPPLSNHARHRNHIRSVRRDARGTSAGRSRSSRNAACTRTDRTTANNLQVGRTEPAQPRWRSLARLFECAASRDAPLPRASSLLCRCVEFLQQHVLR